MGDDKQQVCVVGLGRVGLPTACLLVEAGFEVIGVDSNPKLLEKIKEGTLPFLEPDLDVLLKNSIESGKFKVTVDLKDAVRQSNDIMITVPTLIDRRKNPNYSILKNVCKDIGSSMKRGTLLIVASTTGPGVTESIVKKTLEKESGLKAGTDFALAYSPVRASVGQVVRDLKSYRRLVSGIDKNSLKRAATIISAISEGAPIEVGSIKMAEAAKVFENTYRAVNIALANELAAFCEMEGLDYYEISAASNTQPFCHLHRPGIVGGECIPVNPYFLIAEAENTGTCLSIVTSALRRNEAMPRKVASHVAKVLKQCGKKLKRAKVLILGVSFKANVDDSRNSAARVLFRLLKGKGAVVYVWDPLFKTSELESLGFETTPSPDATLENVDCVIVSVGHDLFRQQKDMILHKLSQRAKVAVVDCSGSKIFSPRDSTENIICSCIGVGPT
ncbi:MAG: nucleotide sugar dehydrogenase [Candidatus Bathyarchaeia archaeon]